MDADEEKSAWRMEYASRGMPSSSGTDADMAVSYFAGLLQMRSITGRALDLGCGKGRNALFLAKKGFEVEGIDFLPELIERLNVDASVKNIPFHGTVHDLREPLPFPDGHFNAIMDVHSYVHLGTKEQQAACRKELHRVLHKDGYLLLVVPSDMDGFYGRLMKDSTDPEQKLVVDPVANVPVFLYDRQDVEKEFGSRFQVVDYQILQKRGLMHGKEYLRQTLVFVFKKL